jgi:TonB family protein
MAMWTVNWDSSAHEILRNRYRRHTMVAALLAAGVTALAATFAPPYAPAPYVPKRIPLPPPNVLPEMIIPPVPATVTAPPVFTGNITISPDAPDAVPLPPKLIDEVFKYRPVFAAPPEARIVPDQLPLPVLLVPAEYPPLAMQLGAEGRVVVAATVDEYGRVVDVAISSSDTIEALETAALEAARKCLFQPAMQGHVPVRCKVEIPFEFRLR